tara:strand:- start:54 stop:560 length:507 start_codon:yes stop_codon:yes gene_type:complete
MNINIYIRLIFLHLISYFAYGLSFYPFNQLNNNSPIFIKNVDSICSNSIYTRGENCQLGDNCGYNDGSIHETIKSSVLCLEHNIDNYKTAMGKQFVINLSSLLPKVDTIGHDVLQANNRFIVDVLSYPNVPDDIKKQIILLSIKLAQYGDDLGSVFLQQYYNLVDHFL